ncbi:hypothetical protein QJS04_geneDACA004822 [Acorus gramineus]|uniref:Reverse transcriptase zinc-binding domain-containing protein n=1 Tax=Acorus gramineus TaxID=55184 RepID=A0AAV9BWX7_ACOGR|nr:hypothetical protein QJS04_geneDACA004822 [Acorus gramineus]
MWLLFQEKLLTKTQRAKWSHQDDLQCLLCGNADESIEHLFEHCPIARQAWNLLKDATGFAPSICSVHPGLLGDWKIIETDGGPKHCSQRED